MDYTNIIYKISDDKVVDFLKYNLRLHLESEIFAEDDEVVDIIADKVKKDDRVEYFFISNDCMHLVKVTFTAFDYQAKQYDRSYNQDMFVDYKNQEQILAKETDIGEKNHQENQVEYISLIANFMRKRYPKSYKKYVEEAKMLLEEDCIKNN